MIEKKLIDINNRYYVKITYHNDNAQRLYRLIEKKTDETVAESFNRDCFLLKANKIIKLSNKLELLIASI
jgi:hypothetical protein